MRISLVKVVVEGLLRRRKHISWKVESLLLFVTHHPFRIHVVLRVREEFGWGGLEIVLRVQLRHVDSLGLLSYSKSFCSELVTKMSRRISKTYGDAFCFLYNGRRSTKK